MFTRPTKENLEIIPREQYQSRKYRYFGSADTYEKAFQLREDAWEKFLELKAEQDKN